jgi:aspartyl/asparaginyl beta-hydroxylase (cupin superfamily)
MEFTEKNPKWFYTLKDTPELKILEENYQVILSELKELIKNSKNGYWLNTFPEYVLPESKNKWEVFTFQFFGIKHPHNCGLCPKTYSILKQIPTLVSADFSYLPAGTHIMPHKGFTKMVLRAHLGLVIPENCNLRVGDEVRTWEPGKMLIFDDSYEHEAWNKSNEDRFVLMLDIASPNWEYNAKDICRYKIENLDDKFMLSLFSKEKWLEFLDSGEFPIY